MVLERIEGKAYARLEVLVGGVVEVRVAEMRRWIRNLAQRGELARDLGGNTAHLVAQAEIGREVGLEVPIVLDVATDEELAEVTRAQRTGDTRLKPAGLIRNEGRGVAEVEEAVGIAERDNVVLQPFKRDSKLDGVPAASEKCVVITLEGGEAEEIRGRRANAADDAGQSGHIDTRRRAPRDNAERSVATPEGSDACTPMLLATF